MRRRIFVGLQQRDNSHIGRPPYDCRNLGDCRTALAAKEKEHTMLCKSHEAVRGSLHSSQELRRQLEVTLRNERDMSEGLKKTCGDFSKLMKERDDELKHAIATKASLAKDLMSTRSGLGALGQEKERLLATIERHEMHVRELQDRVTELRAARCRDYEENSMRILDLMGFASRGGAQQQQDEAGEGGGRGSSHVQGAAYPGQNELNTLLVETREELMQRSDDLKKLQGEASKARELLASEKETSERLRARLARLEMENDILLTENTVAVEWLALAPPEAVQAYAALRGGVNAEVEDMTARGEDMRVETPGVAMAGT